MSLTGLFIAWAPSAEVQIQIGDHETELLPGTEYIRCAYESTPWRMELTERY